MRLIDDPAAYASQFAAALRKDALSLRQWLCVRVRPKPGESLDRGILEQCLSALPMLTCDLLCCEDGEMLLFAKAHEAQHMPVLLDLLTLSAPIIPDMTLYHLAADWQEVFVLLQEKAASAPPQPRAEPATYDPSLDTMFGAARRQRIYRQPPHILLVEDDPITRRLVSNSLKSNYALLCAGSAEEAIALYVAHAPDIVFLDIGLPDADGYEVLHRLLQIDAKAYVVMFSAHHYVDNVVRALNTGASGFIGKPFESGVMRTYIDSSTTHHRLH